jgi:hypothetical protein
MNALTSQIQLLTTLESFPQLKAEANAPSKTTDPGLQIGRILSQILCRSSDGDQKQSAHWYPVSPSHFPQWIPQIYYILSSIYLPFPSAPFYPPLPKNGYEFSGQAGKLPFNAKQLYTS